MRFQSTLPQRERQTAFPCLLPPMIFQSTLPQRERQVEGGRPRIGRTISIHAPTKGATVFLNNLLQLVRISIHAPTKGATKFHAVTIWDNLFQSTLPQRERQYSCPASCLPYRFQSTLPQRERLPFSVILCTLH